MFAMRIGIRQSIVERGISDININPAHADMPAHDLSLPAMIIRIVSPSGSNLLSLVFLLRQLNSIDSLFSKFRYFEAPCERTVHA